MSHLEPTDRMAPHATRHASGHPTRRSASGLIAGFAAMLATGIASRAAGAASGTRGPFEVTKTDDDWRTVLTAEQFYVLRQHGTERPYSSPLDKTYAPGTYHCAGCDLPVFASETKYDSGTGWPSFWQPLTDAVRTATDTSLFMTRTEVHCRRCGGHLGHVFPDGPKPTGQRYCMNGVAMKFVPRATG